MILKKPGGLPKRLSQKLRDGPFHARWAPEAPGLRLSMQAEDARAAFNFAVRSVKIRREGEAGCTLSQSIRRLHFALTTHAIRVKLPAG